MSEFQKGVNQSYEPMLSSMPKDRWSHPQIPIEVMDPPTRQLVQADATLITEKQRSLDVPKP